MMPLRKLFWVLSGVTIAFLILQAFGYPVLDIIVSLLLIDLVVVEISRQEDKHQVESQLRPELLARVGNVEKLCSNILSSIGALPTLEHFYHVAEERINEHKTILKNEIKEDLDRLAKKAIDIENKLFDLRKNVSSGIMSIDDRLRALETGKWTFSSDEEPETEVLITESPSEEVVYGENVIE